MLIEYNPILKLRATELRINQTPAEKLLWGKIRRKKLKGRKFLRQRPTDNYIVDFVCFKARLIVEVDGPIHNKQKEMDKLRQEQLECLGFKVLRFTNNEVEKNMYHVIQTIYQHI